MHFFQHYQKYKFDPMDFETMMMKYLEFKIMKYKFDPMDFETRRNFKN